MPYSQRVQAYHLSSIHKGSTEPRIFKPKGTFEVIKSLHFTYVDTEDRSRCYPCDVAESERGRSQDCSRGLLTGDQGPHALLPQPAPQCTPSETVKGLHTVRNVAEEKLPDAQLTSRNALRAGVTDSRGFLSTLCLHN